VSSPGGIPVQEPFTAENAEYAEKQPSRIVLGDLCGERLLDGSKSG
jgi:hypothetical protein